MATASNSTAHPAQGRREDPVPAFTRETPGGRIVFGPGRLTAVGDEVRRLDANRVLLIHAPSGRETDTAGNADSPVNGIDVRDSRD